MSKQMFGVKQLLTFVAASMVSAGVWADTECPNSTTGGTIEAIQVQDSSVLVKQTDTQWHLVGRMGSNGTREKLAALTAAQIGGKNVIIRYFGTTVSCNVYEIATPSTMVRVLTD